MARVHCNMVLRLVSTYRFMTHIGAVMQRLIHIRVCSWHYLSSMLHPVLDYLLCGLPARQYSFVFLRGEVAAVAAHLCLGVRPPP